MNFDNTESNILIIARALEQQAAVVDIVSVYTEAGFSSDDIFLLVKAAEQLVADRQAAPIRQPMFKRVP